MAEENITKMMNETIIDKKYRYFSLHVREGGLNQLVLSECCGEYSRSIGVCAPFWNKSVVDAEEAQNNVIQEIKIEKLDLRGKKSENNCQLKRLRGIRSNEIDLREGAKLRSK